MNENTKIVYVLTGTPHEDVDTPSAPYQGQVLHTYTKTNGQWNLVMRTADGSPYLGYMAREISEAEAAKWKLRLKKIQERGAAGYKDSEGYWFPGNVPNSILTKDAWEKFQAFQEHRFYALRAETLIKRALLQKLQAQQLEELTTSGKVAARKVASEAPNFENLPLLRDPAHPLEDKRAIFRQIMGAI